MPASSGCAFERSKIAKSISLVTAKSEATSILFAVSAEIAIFDATSPPACPPMPSATATNSEETIPESSLPSRTNPRSESAKTLNANDDLDISASLLTCSLIVHVAKSRWAISFH